MSILAPALISSGRTVRDAVRDGWELWHLSPDALPGRWELRRGQEIKRVHWDAILIVRRRYLAWFEQHTKEVHEGRFTWIYRAKQSALSVESARA